MAFLKCREDVRNEQLVKQRMYDDVGRGFRVSSYVNEETNKERDSGMGTKREKISATGNKVYKMESLQMTEKKRYQNVYRGIAGNKKRLSSACRERMKYDRKKCGKGRTGKKSQQYKEWEQRRRTCIFSAGRRNGRFGRNGKK